MDFQRHRLLDDSDEDDGEGLSTVDILRATLRLYGLIFLVLFLVYLYRRPRNPRSYNCRKSVPSINDGDNALAEDAYGELSWIWKIFKATDEELFHHAGLDAVAFLRILRFGIKVALVGCFNALYLIPTYATANEGCAESDDESCTVITDRVEKAGLGNVTAGNHELFAATVAAYILFGSAMYFLYKEFHWFTKNRHKFLSLRRPDNYTVYCRHIPPDLRSNGALLDYFGMVFPADSVLEAQIALKIPKLDADVKKREALVGKLEHAINVKDVKGQTPQHKTKMCCGTKVDSIPAYAEDLFGLNAKISDCIDMIRRENGSSNDDCKGVDSSIETDSYSCDEECGVATIKKHRPAQGSTITAGSLMIGSINVAGDVIEEESNDAEISVPSELTAVEQLVQNEEDNMQKKKEYRRTRTFDALRSSIHSAVSAAASVLMGSGEGSPRDSAFVTFTDVKSKAAALQMIHHRTPFVMDVLEAPLPKDVYWSNVGKSHLSQQSGALLGQTLTALLCVFWTIPVTFISTLAEVDELKKLLPFLESWVDTAPWLEQALAQLKPLMVVLLVALLPIILLSFAKMEGHIAETTLQASLFSKLSAFLIIQIFFVQLISGSIMSQLDTAIDNPSSIIELLAEALPAQASSFMQYVMVETFLGVGVELLRVGPVAIAWIRGKIGPNLTNKERESVWLGLSPLNEPGELDHASLLSDLILYYVILFVYSVLQPITSFQMGFSFFLLSLCYRNQFIYIYDPSNDTGGQLWTRCFRLIITCMLIAEVTLFGVLGLKEGVIAGPLLLPLLIGTIIFSRYLKQRHYTVTEHLPSKDCVILDHQNKSGKIDMDFLRGQYIQPALQTRVLEPENLREEHKTGALPTVEERISEAIVELPAESEE